MSNEDRGPAGADSGKGMAKRVGNADRDVAVALLEEHWQAGRLDPAEHELRVTRARAAVTQADLDSLFIDLPSPGRAVDPSAVAGTATGGPGGFLEGKRETVMALMPFAALVLFFTTRSWMWFLLVPVAGILLYGAEDGGGSRNGWFWRGRGR